MDGGGSEREKKSGVGGCTAASGIGKVTRRAVSVLYENCQSLISKIQELQAVVSLMNPDVIMLTETWTHSEIHKSYLEIGGYELLVRKDRTDTAKGRGGGLLIYVKNEISAWEVEKENEVCQVGGIGIKGKSGSDTHLYLVYRSPNTSSEENDTKLNSWIEKLTGRYAIFGDLNYPEINWEDNTSTETKSRKFVEVIDSKFLIQFVEGPTHIGGNTLDLIIGSDENIVSEVEKEGRLGASDHEMLTCTVEIDAKVQESKTQKRDYSKMNSVELQKALERDWEAELAGLGTEDTWKKFKEIVTQAMDDWVPWKRKGGRRKPRWMNGKIERLIDKKKRLWARFRESKKQRDREAYKVAEKELKSHVRKAKKNLEKKVADQSKENPKQFYQYLKGQRANRVKVGPLKDKTGRLVVDAKEQATLLNSQYVSVFTVDDGAAIPELEPELDEDKEMSTVNFTWEKVKKKLDGLNKDSAGGPDGIPPRILKEFSKELSKPLTILFQRSMDESVIPADWKDSEVVPLYKGGSKFEPPSYRPVNLTVACCRVMESLINDEVETHLETNKLIRQTQHGFRRGHSCQTNLIEFWGKVLEWVDEGEPVDVKFYDFAKAFDKVERRRLVLKVRAKGIKGKLLAWIAEWLRGRRQRVVIEGETSEWEPVASSVIQGSVLGPTLFKIFIDDIDAETEVLSSKFADDTKSAQVVRSEEDRDRYQREGEKFEKWADTWGMTFNADKCKVMHVGRNNQRLPYTMSGQQMKTTEVEKDLGVMISRDMKPSQHCAKAAKSGNSTLGQISRAFHYRNKEVMAKLFKVFVRPKLEYAAQAWSPWLDKDCELLENVQKRCIKMMTDVKGETYEEKLKDAGLQLLKARRDRGDMIETYKVLRGIEKVDVENWFERVEPQRRTRQNAEIGEEGVMEKDVLKEQRSRVNEKRHFFQSRVVQDWNGLPAAIQKAPSLNAFKSRYDKYMKTASRQ